MKKKSYNKLKFKTMKKKLNIYIIITTLILIFMGCSEDFLDIRPIAAENSGSFYLLEEDGIQAVTTAYGMLNHVSFDKNLVMVLDACSDDAEAGGEFVNEVPSMENFNRLVPLTTEGELETTYGVSFRSIYFSNLAMEKIPEIIETDPEADPALINRLVAECKFLRAFNYSNLTRYFGSVPLVDHVLGADEYYAGKAPLKDIYTLMENDLKEAIEVLPERSEYGSSDIGRASKGAARAYLAKILLYESSYARNYPGDERFAGMEERWGEVLQYAEQVINSGEYSLPGIDGERYYSWRNPQTNGYRYVHTSDGDNTEGIFEIQDITDGLGWAFARGNAITQYISARRYIDTLGNPQNSDYWGLNLPTHNLIDEFEEGDPRLAASIAYEGSGDSIEIAGGVRYLISYDKSVTNTYCTKYECSAAEFKDVPNTPWHSAPINIKMLRYADLLLMAAEAAVMLEQNDKALQYINEVRTRARLCGPEGNTVPADLTGTVTLEDIIHERRVELNLEGHRFTDLVRWNLATQYLNHYTEDGYEVVFESPKNDFLPLPQQEIDVNNNLEQNPGW
jgi:starch-binding outer membrane protein, SusD/RagB family